MHAFMATVLPYKVRVSTANTYRYKWTAIDIAQTVDKCERMSRFNGEFGLKENSSKICRVYGR